MNVEELLAEFRADLESAVTDPLERLSADAVVWLGLVPEWSIGLAEAAGFPTTSQSVDDWVVEAERSAVCRVAAAQPYSGDGTLRFWMPEPSRNPVFNAAMQEIDSPLDLLVETAHRVAKAIEATNAVWADSLRPWVELATTSPYDAGEELLRRVRYLEGDGDLHGAHRWIVAAERLEPIMGADLSSAVRRARRHIALHHRRRHDEVVMRQYIPRPDLVGPFEDLLESESTWALHYLGDGGVGKTSLLRMLTAQRSRSAEPLLFARVDFDHVSPEYPWRRPAQLLSLLADELEIAALSADQERKLAEFRRSERRSSEVGSASESSMSLDSKEFELALRDFAELLTRLPGRAVLVLDTCEELAKYHEPGEPVAAVDYTFEILERLHSLVPSTRVVFAGRRLLARHGADTSGWAAVERNRDRAPERRRDYLDLCHVRGFTRIQAELFLEEKCSIESRSVRDGILAATEEVDAAGLPGHNPFDVALYAAWAGDDPDFDADVIREDDGVRYVEQRIVGRLEAELDDVVPTLVALGGRATPELLARACGSDVRAEAMHARLRLQEWIDPVATSLGEVLVVQPRLLARFRRYVESSELASPRLVLERVESRLRASFDAGIADRPSELSPTTAVVAFRLVGAARAREQWLALESAAERYDEWNELQRLASLLAAEPVDGGLPESASELRSMVLATHANASARTGGGRRQLLDRLAATDVSVEASPPPTPDRVATGTGVSADDAEIVRRNVVGFIRRYPTPPIGSDPDRGRFVTDFETVLDEAARHGVDVAPLSVVVHPLEQHMLRTVKAGPLGELDSFVLALIARWRMMIGDAAGAADAFHRAERGMAAGPEGDRVAHPSWIRPEHPIDRVRLLYVEAAVGLDPPPSSDDMLRWYREACRRIETIDGNRLAARLLIHSTEVAATSFIDEPPTSGDLLGPATWTLALHDRVPPLLAAVAIAEARAGMSERARSMLAAAKRDLANSDERLTRAIELVELRLSLADGQEVEGRVDALARADDRRAPLAAAWLAVHRRRWSTDSPVLSPHERWRSSGDANTPRLVGVLEEEHARSTGLDREEVALDLFEADMLGLRVTMAVSLSDRSPFGSTRADGVFDTVTWERRVRSDIRRAALGDDDMPWRTWRAAELATEEGSLVSPRLPLVAARLHEFAGTVYADHADRSSDQVTALHTQLGSVTGSADEPDALRVVRHAVWPRVKRALPLLSFLVALGVFGWLTSRSGDEPVQSPVMQSGLIVMVILLYVAIGWLLYGRRLYRGPVGLLPLSRRWPYWVSWRVQVWGAADGEVSVERATRHAGIGSPAIRALLLLPQVYTWWFERLRLRQLRRRLQPWRFSLVPPPEPPGSGPAEAAPSAQWRMTAERVRSTICVEVVVEYDDEHRQVERDMARRFGLEPQTRRMAFFRRTAEEEPHIVHPLRRSARRAGVRIVAARPLATSLADAWSDARVAINHIEFDRQGMLEVGRATVVHVVGSPYETSSGWVIEPTPGTFDKSVSSAEVPESFGRFSLKGTRSPRLVVLQPSPALEVAGIADAREVAGCRQVARALRFDGCPVVAVLPMVSTEIGVAVVECFADLVSDHHLGRLRLMDVSVGVRSFLAERLRGETEPDTIPGIVSDFSIYTNR